MPVLSICKYLLFQPSTGVRSGLFGITIHSLLLVLGSSELGCQRWFFVQLLNRLTLEHLNSRQFNIWIYSPVWYWHTLYSLIYYSLSTCVLILRKLVCVHLFHARFKHCINPMYCIYPNMCLIEINLLLLVFIIIIISIYYYYYYYYYYYLFIILYLFIIIVYLLLLLWCYYLIYYIILL